MLASPVFSCPLGLGVVRLELHLAIGGDCLLACPKWRCNWASRALAISHTSSDLISSPLILPLLLNLGY